jgi:Ca-activated chloride channel family protein
VLVLLTDGVNQPAVPEPLDPLQAARLARSLGVTLYTIGLGRPGRIARRLEPVTGLELAGEVEGPDLVLLQEMADLGGGRMFVADDAAGLAAVLREVDALERSPVQGTIHTRYRDWYYVGLAAAVVLLVIDRIVSAGRLRRVP